MDNAGMSGGDDGRETNGFKQKLLAVCAAITIVLTLTGAYTTAWVAISTNTRAIEDQRRELDDFVNFQRQWDNDERAYDAEVRRRLNEINDETRKEIDGIRAHCRVTQ